MPDQLLNFDAIENELRERRRVGNVLANVISGIAYRESRANSAYAGSLKDEIKQWDAIKQQPLRLPKEDGK